MTITILPLSAILKRSTMFTIQERTGMMFRPPHTLPVYYIRVGERSSNELNGRPHLLIRSGNGGCPFLYCSSLAEPILKPISWFITPVFSTILKPSTCRELLLEKTAYSRSVSSCVVTVYALHSLEKSGSISISRHWNHIAAVG